MRYDGPGFYGLNPPLWVSGAALQPAGQWVTSPADKEVYQRIAATNNGTTDPADDVTNYVARSYERTVSLANGAILSAGTTVSATTVAVGSTQTLIAAITASVRASVLSVSGRGYIDYLLVSKAATNTMLVEVVCDGRTILNQTETFATQTGLLVLGQAQGVANTNQILFAAFAPKGVEFRRSLQVFLTPITTGSAASALFAYNLRSVA